MKFCIVVARYNENIEWTKTYQNVLIYNKGSPLSDEFNPITLDNVGREGHTYYKHICDNYDNLADYTIFLQGNPFDHSPNLLSQLSYYMNEELNIDFEFLSDFIVPCSLRDCSIHIGLPLMKSYEKLFGERTENMEFKFGAGAQFIVSKKRILQRPKEFYLKIVDFLNKDSNPVEGHVIERFHTLIFN